MIDDSQWMFKFDINSFYFIILQPMYVRKLGGINVNKQEQE